MGPLVAASQVASQVATGLGVVAGAMMVRLALDQRHHDDHQHHGGEWRPRCSTCNGTGRVECLCARWSDGDVGCGSCAGSGRMACRSCGGRGTGRPIPSRVSIRSSNNVRPP